MSALHKEKKSVVVAMSGGVDSSVAAALLVREGYEVMGMMMRLWSEPGKEAANRCCTPDQMADARRVADYLDIPFYVVDVQDHFRKTIVQFFIDEHEAGRTPNPCIECNRQIRFDYLLERALLLGADYLATGHYAQIEDGDGLYRLKKGIDPLKDQSYVLHVMRQKELSQVLFPVGQYTKAEVKRLGLEMGLPLPEKSESMDLCFLGDNDYRRFLADHATFVPEPGPIFNLKGEELGVHTGLIHYTIGQRKGLGIAAPEPLYVIQKDAGQNALIVGSREEVGKRRLYGRRINWVEGVVPAEPIKAMVKIRYKAKAEAATVIPLDGERVEVIFEEPIFGLTAGQGVVFYDGDYCIGGGFIADEVPN